MYPRSRIGLPVIQSTSIDFCDNLPHGRSHTGTHDLLTSVDLPQRETRVRAKCASILGSEHADNLWHQVAEGDMSATQWVRAYCEGSA